MSLFFLPLISSSETADKWQAENPADTEVEVGELMNAGETTMALSEETPP